MATKLEKTLKREIDVDGKAYMLAISPEGLKLTEKGRRKGQELSWKGVLNGQAAAPSAHGRRDGDRDRDRGRRVAAYRRQPVIGARGLMVFMQTVVSSFCTPGMRRISIRSS